MKSLREELIGVYQYGNYGISEILDYVEKFKNCENWGGFYLYGEKEEVYLLCDYYAIAYNIFPRFIVLSDSNEFEQYRGIDIIHESDIKERINGKRYLGIVATLDWNTRKEEIRDVLLAYGTWHVCGPGNILNPFKKEWYPEYFISHLDDFEATYYELVDDISKQTFIEYLKVYICGQRYSGKTYPEQYKYWGIDSDSKHLFHLDDDVVFLNIGACLGDTIFNFLKTHHTFGEIIGVEGSKSSYDVLVKMIDLLPDNIKDRIVLENRYLGKEYSIDESYSQKQIGLICMDIEGAEMEVLSTGLKTIQTCRPVLAICGYHKRDDLVTIPQFAKDNLKDYLVLLRKYPSVYWNWFDGIQQCNELVIYLIPREKFIV